MNGKIAVLSTPEEFAAVEVLELEVWGIPPQEGIPAHVMIALGKMGGITLGYYDHDTLVGFSFTVPALDNNGEVLHYLHALGISSSHRGHNIGYQLMQHQKTLSLAMGIHCLSWTFDPLEARNAHLYIGKLAAQLRGEYVVNMYGSLNGLNEGLASDRVYAHWDLLQKPKAPNKIYGSVEDLAMQYPILYEESALSIIGTDSQQVAIHIPEDFQRLKSRNMALAKTTRIHYRSLLQAVFRQGKKIVNFISIQEKNHRANFYISD